MAAVEPTGTGLRRPPNEGTGTIPLAPSSPDALFYRGRETAPTSAPLTAETGLRNGIASGQARHKCSGDP